MIFLYLKFEFQHTAARRRLLCSYITAYPTIRFQHTAARRRLHNLGVFFFTCIQVSTHSRPKAAACSPRLSVTDIESFNTQPPEGGCRLLNCLIKVSSVSTHSRPKAAALLNQRIPNGFVVSTHSRPKAAAAHGVIFVYPHLFQHTAARRRLRPPIYVATLKRQFQHTAARRRLLPCYGIQYRET